MLPCLAVVYFHALIGTNQCLKLGSSMEAQHVAPVVLLEEVLRLVQELHGDLLPLPGSLALARAITPYVARSQLSLHAAVCTIVPHYLKEGQRVRRLLADPAAEEWQVVLTKVITFARRHTLAPDESKMTGAPDLDAYGDIQRNLASYNFEAPFDSWVAAIVTRRLQRFWRDRAALRAGGGGFMQQVLLEVDHYSPAPARRPRVVHLSLDVLAGVGSDLFDRLAVTQPSVAEAVEATELAQMVAAIVDSYAGHKHDPALAQIWGAIFDQNLKPREAADCFGLSVSQIYRRIGQVRTYLRQDVQLRQWLDPGDEGPLL
jgi:DNA-directed RNA polymerase specialized sigma24 family protein